MVFAIRVQVLIEDMRIRVHVLAGFVMVAGFCKNHDEPINYIVRVRQSFFYPEL